MNCPNCGERKPLFECKMVMDDGLPEMLDLCEECIPRMEAREDVRYIVVYQRTV